MSKFKHSLSRLFFATAIWLLQPVFAYAFELIELVIKVDLQLEPEQEVSLDYSKFEIPNTGFTIANPGQKAIHLEGNSAIGIIETPEQEIKQEDFVLLDTTLMLELDATDPAGGRAGIRATYRMNVPAARFGIEAMAQRLIKQGIALDEGRATVRARAMGLADARVMRLYHDENGARWVRAVRAIRTGSIDDLDVRFMPRMEPDGVLGHFGTDFDNSGNAYVWAVMDRNSEYAVGFTIDRDDDGFANSDDNCIDITNPGQDNHDDDAQGDACDDNDDNDEWPDNVDNCPLHVNDDQADWDADGIGDACDADADNDSVNDGVDECPDTANGAVVNQYGCSIADICPCENDWKHHGAYVRCVARASHDFAAERLISWLQGFRTVFSAWKSSCGRGH